MIKLELLRRQSDTPNVSNSDDACMARYAYGNTRGIVQNVGAELTAEISGINKILINPGRAVIDGWEINVDGGSLELSLPSSGTFQKYIGIELNLASETATIKEITNISDDDLTQSPSGIGKLILYRCDADNTGLYNLVKVASNIPYLSEVIERLDKLGFKEGNITSPDGVTIKTEKNILENGEYAEFPINKITRQSNYVIGKYYCYSSGGFPVEIIESTITGFEIKRYHIGTIPSQFLPKTEEIIYASIDSYLVFNDVTPENVRITTDGKIMIDFTSTAASNSYCHTARIQIGYEAAPL